MSELKWSITVGKKPRGMWRPAITLKFWNEGDKSNSLNIDSTYENQNRFSLPGRKKGGNCSSYGEIVDNLPVGLPFFSNSTARDTKQPAKCCSENFSIGFWKFDFFENYSNIYFPEWRPGIPDYSDYVEFVRNNWCLPAVAEYERRIAKAMESVELEEQIFNSEDYLIQKREEENKIRPLRKLKVA